MNNLSKYRTYFKDGKTYFFNSKYEQFNNLYGVDEKDKEDVNNNLKKQINYLKDTYLNIDNGEKFLNLYDIAYGANIKPKQYHAEIWNRVTSLQKYAIEKKYTSVFFLTITPPSYLKPLKQINIGKNKIRMVDNPNFCGLTDYVKEAREHISQKWRKFLRQRIFKEIKQRYGENLIYLRVYEPMLDGTPHLHLMCFVPDEFAKRFYNLVQNYFSDTRFDIKNVFENEKHVTAYILKYILKSFKHVDNTLSDVVSYWYVKNKIRRFTTSRTLIPLQLFRILKRHDEFQDIYATTKEYKNDMFNVELILCSNHLFSKDYNDLTKSDYKIATVEVYRPDGLGYSLEILYKRKINITKFEKEDNPNIKFDPNKKTYHQVKYDNNKKMLVYCSSKELPNQQITPVYVNNSLKYILHNDNLITYKPNFQKMSDMELFNYFTSLDFETSNQHHIAYIHNLLAQRGFFSFDNVPMDYYQSDKFFQGNLHEI